MLPDQLLPLLRVPGTDREVRLVVESTADGIPFSGWLLDRGYTAVARLLNFRFRFTAFDAEAETRAARRAGEPVALPPMPTPVPVPMDSPRLAWAGSWSGQGTVRLAEPVPGTQVGLESAAPLLTLHFVGAPRSGTAEVKRDGVVVASAVLDGPTAGLPQAICVANPEGTACTITVEPTPGSGQVRLSGIEEHVGPEAVPRPAQAAPARGRLPQHPALAAALAGLPQDALALDVGGGARRLADPRVIALDSRPYPAPDLLADGEALPFASGSMDLVHSNGELNRTPDPARLAAELRRVLKPGGTLLLGAVPGPGTDQLWRPMPAALERLCAGLEDVSVRVQGDPAARLRALLNGDQPLPEAAEQALQALIAAVPHRGGVPPYQLWASGRKPA